MRIIIDLIKKGNAFPKVYNLLKQIPDNILQNNDFNLRHPLGLYNVSIGKIISKMESILNEYNQLKSSNNTGYNLDSIKNRLSDLLHAVLSHFDDCYSIMQTLYPLNKVNINTRFIDKRLENGNHPTIRSFKNNIKPFRDYIAVIVNNIKHNNARIMGTTWKSENELIFGFFLDGEVNNGAISPFQEFNDGKPASLNRDLRFILYGFYEIGEHLDIALKDAIYQEFSVSIDSNKKIESDSKKMEDVIVAISQLSKIFLPSESSKKVPVIEVRELSNSCVFKMVYPSSLNPVIVKKASVTHELSKGDGVTKNFKGNLF